jgi:protein phosphatase
VTKLRGGSATDVGRVRSNNQDNLVVTEHLFGVADGMGGAAGGEVASLVAIEALRASFESDPTVEGLIEAVREANRAVWERADEQPDLRGMGTTMTALALVDDDDEEVLVLVHVGDSRAYLLRDGELEQLTEDHSLVHDMVRAGQMTEDEAAVHPQRHIVTRVLGMGPEVEPDDYVIVPYKGDRFVLASDGLSGEVADNQIASILRRRADPGEAAKELVDVAKSNGGADNITVVVVDVVDDDDRSVTASAALSDDRRPLSQTQRDVELAALADEEHHHEGPTGSFAGDDEEDERADPDRDSWGLPHRRVTARVVGFIVVLLLVLGGAVAAVGFYARSSYFVGLDGRSIVIYKGRPGGLLGFDPTLADRTGVLIDDVLPSRRPALRDGKVEPSLEAARRYVANLTDEAGGAPRSTPLPEETTTTTLTPTPSSTPTTSVA